MSDSCDCDFTLGEDVACTIDNGKRAVAKNGKWLVAANWLSGHIERRSHLEKDSEGISGQIGGGKLREWRGEMKGREKVGDFVFIGF
jgi:hypothetical protein